MQIIVIRTERETSKAAEECQLIGDYVKFFITFTAGARWYRLGLCGSLPEITLHSCTVH